MNIFSEWLDRRRRVAIVNGLKSVQSSLEWTDVSDQQDTTGHQPVNPAAKAVQDVLAVLPQEVTIQIALPFMPKQMRFCIAIGVTYPVQRFISPEPPATTAESSSKQRESRGWFGRKENGA